VNRKLIIDTVAGVLDEDAGSCVEKHRALGARVATLLGHPERRAPAPRTEPREAPMSDERQDYIRRNGYDPFLFPEGVYGPVRPEFFPVRIPAGFKPSDIDGDGVDLNWKHKECPGQDASDGFKPKWGGGFFSPRGQHLHAAIDIMAAEGAHIVAPVTGTIPRTVTVSGEKRPGAGESTKGGFYLFLVCANGWEWYFSHLRDMPLFGPGDTVEAGALLGFNGRSGNAARERRVGIRGCPHLHLRIGKQLWKPGQARKYDARTLIEPLYEHGWRA
jgi:murein DD-endopeptidase MepM/ murein hydrolase activator NlpD